MKLKIRKTNKDGIVRLESGGEIKEVLINEDILNPGQESISVCFRGENSSGIIDLTPQEIDKLMNTVRGRLHLIKSIKRL